MANALELYKQMMKRVRDRVKQILRLSDYNQLIDHEALDCTPPSVQERLYIQHWAIEEF